jgi:hypothetical protein
MHGFKFQIAPTSVHTDLVQGPDDFRLKEWISHGGLCKS